MGAFLLDTNHLQVALRPASPLRERLVEQVKQGDRFGTCVPVLCELEAGFHNLARREIYHRAMRRLVQNETLANHPPHRIGASIVARDSPEWGKIRKGALALGTRQAKRPSAPAGRDSIEAVSQSKVEQVKAYIGNQQEHHRRWSFQDELRALLRRHEIEYDERYVGD